MTLIERIAASRASRRDDRGTSLVLALVFITVVSVALAVLLSFAITSLRATVLLRGQASRAAGADGAAQVAIDALRHGTYDGVGQCFGGSGTMVLSNFYQPPSGTADSAAVVCEPDGTTSIPSKTLTIPGYALLTTSTSGTEDGTYIKANGGGGINTQGSVGSKSTITTDHGQLIVTGNLLASGACTGTITVSGTRTCNSATPPVVPSYATPPAPTGAGSISACAAKMTFQPGIYSSLSDLNTAMNCHNVKVFDFRPGIYYFSYSGIWTIDTGTMVAGSDVALGTTPPSIPGACPSQINPTTPNLSAGVMFVFGGTAQVNISKDAQVEICGRYSATTPPIAIYGLQTTIGSGANTVPAQSGCVTSTVTLTKCGVLVTDNQSSDVVFYVQGLTYVPAAWVDLDLRRSTDQFFVDGLIARAFSVFAPASTVPPSPLASIPISGFAPGRTTVYLTVYVCTGVSTCSSGSGTVRLRVKVGLSDPSGVPVAGQRQITVYSWSVQR